MNIPDCLPGDELGHGSVVEVVQASLAEFRKHLLFRGQFLCCGIWEKLSSKGSSGVSEEEFI